MTTTHKQLNDRATSAQHIQQLIRLACVCIFSTSALVAADSKNENNSPFLPPGFSNEKPEPPKPPTPVNGPLSREIEFRGIVQLDGVYQFSLFNKKENRSYWMTEDEAAESGITVRNFDPAAMRITVTQNGRTEHLTLMDATDSPLPVASAAPQISTGNGKQPNNIPGLKTNTRTRSASSTKVIPRRRVILPKK